MKTSESQTRKTVLILISVILLVTCFAMIREWNLLTEGVTRDSGSGYRFWILMGLSYAAVGLGCYHLAYWRSKSQNDMKMHEESGRSSTDDQQQNEKMLQRYRLISENMRDIILFIRVRDGQILEANQAAVQAYGYELQDLLTKSVRDLRAPDTRHLVEKQLEQAKTSGIIFESLHQRKDGSIFPVEISSVSVTLDHEMALLSIIRNITERKRIEERLQENEEIFSQFLEHSPVYVFFKDENIRSIRLSRNYESLLGKPLDELLGKDMHDLFPSDLARSIIADDTRTLKEDREIVVDEEFNGRSYTTIKFPIHIAGKPRYLAGYTMDITDRKQAERALAASIRRLQTTVTGAPIIIYSFDQEGIITLSEGKGLSFMGLKPGEMVGQSIFTVYHDQPDILKNLRRALAGETFNASVNMGGYTFETYYSSLLNDHAEYAGTVGVMVDITRQRKAEDALIKRAAELATVAEISTATSTVLDTRILLQNVVDLTRERFGLYHAHIYLLDDAGETLILAAGAGEVGRQMASNGHSISMNREHSLVARAARTRQSVITNDVSQSPDFLSNPLLAETRSEMSIPLVFGEDILGVLDVQSEQINHFSEEDIHIHTALASQIANSIQNTRQYQRIHATASSLEGIQNAINEGAIVVITDATGRIEFVNENMLIASGYSREDLIGQDLRILNSNYHEEKFLRDLWGTVSVGKVWRGELGNCSRDGTVYWVDTTISPILNEKGESVQYVSVGFDITQRKHAESALRESEARYRALVESQVDLVSRYLPDTTLTFVNDAYCQFYGKTRDELIGYSFLAMVAPEFHEQTLKETGNFLKDPRPVGGEYLNYTWDGRECWIHWIIQGIMDDSGKVVELQAIGRDITALKQAEKALRESQQMLRTVLDQFPGVVYWKNRQSVYLGCNQASATAAGLANPAEIIGKTDLDLPWAESEAMAYRADDIAVINSGQPRLGVIESQHRANGDLAWLDTAKVPLVDEMGNVIGVLGTSRDITAQVRTLHALQETEFFLNRSQEVARIGSYELDLASGNWIGSPSLDNILGINTDFPKTANGWLSLVAPEDRDRMREHLFQHVMTEHQRFEKEYRIIRPSDGRMCWVSGMGELEFDDAERPIRMIGTIQDITERKTAETALQQATLIVENSPVILFRRQAAEGWPVVLVSQNILQYGYSPDELLSGSVMFASIVHPDDLERFGREVRGYTESGIDRFTQEYRIITKDNRIRWIEDRTMVERDSNGLVTHYQGIVVDVTDRKQAEMALLEKSEELDRFFSNVLDLLCIADTNGHFQRLNGEWERSLGYSVSELVGRKFLDFVHPEDQAATLGAMSALRGGGEVFNFINRYRCKDGHYRWIEWRSFAAGTLIYAAARDITERKQMEDRLRESEERLQQAIRVSNIGIFDHDQITDIIYWSPEVRKSFGIGLDETYTLPDFINQLHPDDLKETGLAIQQAHDPAGDGSFTVEYRFIRRDGVVRWFAAKSQTFFGGDGDTKHPVRTIGALIDVTDRKQIDEELRESRNLLKAVLDTIPVRIFWKDTGLRFLGCNQPFAMDAGVVSSDEIIGKDDYQLNWRQQADLYRSDDRKVLESGIPRFNYEEMQTTPDGRYIWLRTSKVPLKGADGVVRGILGTYEDITERKRIEEDRETLIEELETKNAELERFTYTVSHDLKAPLVTIKGFLGFIKQDVATGNMERFDSDLERIGNAAKKMEQLLKDLLELSRIGRMLNPMEKISFDDLIYDAMDIVHGRLEAHKITIHVQPDLPAVYGDRQRLIEVMQNLLDNAAKYMGTQEKPHIEIGLHGSDNGKFTFFVSDNGMGIAPEYHTRVFGLFNKLDVKSEGTGIGLALVKRIIEFHGGHIWIESNLGKGSTFLFTLPMVPSKNPLE